MAVHPHLIPVKISEKDRDVCDELERKIDQYIVDHRQLEFKYYDISPDKINDAVLAELKRRYIWPGGGGWSIHRGRDVGKFTHLLFLAQP